MKVSLIHVAILSAGIGIVPAAAQAPPPEVTDAEGVVIVDDKRVVAGATLPDASVLRTATGRAIVRLSRGAVVAVDNNTQIRIHRNHPYNSNRIEILEGTAIVMSGSQAPLVSCQDEARLSTGGIFRFDVQRPYANGRACRLRVFEGAAAVQLVTVITALRDGESMDLDPRCGDMIGTSRFTRETLDDFDEWSRQRAALVAHGGQYSAGG